MKKFVLAFGIPVLAVASLIGSGYATWYFNSDVAIDNKGITVEPTEKRVVGAKFTNTKDENFKLVFDQSPKTDGMPDGRKGVHFEGTFSESLEANDGVTNMFVNGTSYEVTTKITIPSEVAKYVNFTLNKVFPSDDVTSRKSDDNTSLILTRKSTYGVVDETTNKFEVFKISDVASVTSDVTVAYYIEAAEGTAKEPSTPEEYDTMKGAMTDPASGEFNKSISISFEAKIVTTTK